MAAGPDVLNHNIETVPRLYRQVRTPGDLRTLPGNCCKRVREVLASRLYKIRVDGGLGEGDEEVLDVLGDLHQHRVDIVTIGQYLSPGPKHLPVQRFVSPEQFQAFRLHGETELSFLQVVSLAPLHPVAATTPVRCDGPDAGGIPAERPLNRHLHPLR